MMQFIEEGLSGVTSRRVREASWGGKGAAQEHTGFRRRFTTALSASQGMEDCCKLRLFGRPKVNGSGKVISVRHKFTEAASDVR